MAQFCANCGRQLSGFGGGYRVSADWVRQRARRARLEMFAFVLPLWSVSTMAAGWPIWTAWLAVLWVGCFVAAVVMWRRGVQFVQDIPRSAHIGRRCAVGMVVMSAFSVGILALSFLMTLWLATG